MRPNGITIYSKRPYLVRNADIYTTLPVQRCVLDESTLRLHIEMEYTWSIYYHKSNRSYISRKQLNDTNVITTIPLQKKRYNIIDL